MKPSEILKKILDKKDKEPKKNIEQIQMLTELLSSNPKTSQVQTSFELQRKILDQLAKLSTTENPHLDSKTDYIFVLSARRTVLKTRIDAVESLDEEDDYDRVRLAIDSARKICALRLNKTIESLSEEDMILAGPTIIYNGVKRHNQDLVRTFIYNGDICPNVELRQAFIQVKPLFDKMAYPLKKFEILDLDPSMLNTKGQFICVKNKLKINNTTVAVVTHAYHYPRVSRMLGTKAPLYPFAENVKCYALLVDRALQSPGIEDNLLGEIERIPVYIAKGDLSDQAGSDLIDSKIHFNKKPSANNETKYTNEATKQQKVQEFSPLILHYQLRLQRINKPFLRLLSFDDSDLEQIKSKKINGLF
jgi:hypothetical protein